MGTARLAIIARGGSGRLTLVGGGTGGASEHAGAPPAPDNVPPTTPPTVQDLVRSPLIGPPSARLDDARGWARQRRALRPAEVDAYLAEVWRLGADLGYDPAVVAAHASAATAGWTAPAWAERLDPAALGGAPALPYRSGQEAARAHLVRLSAYVAGWDRRLTPYIALDPGFGAVFAAGHVGGVATVADLAVAWAGDPGAARLVAEHLFRIRRAMATPGPTPAPAGRAPLPAGIVYVGTANRRPRTFGQTPVAIVYHTTNDPDPASTAAWYRDPGSGASAHALIDRDGLVRQFVSSTEAAWANGRAAAPRGDIPWLAAALRRTAGGGPLDLDDFTLAVALAGTPAEPPTEAQYAAAVALSAYWTDRYAIARNRGHLLRHADLDSVDRPDCPGPRFDLRRLILALGGDPEDTAG